MGRTFDHGLIGEPIQEHRGKDPHIRAHGRVGPQHDLDLGGEVRYKAPVAEILGWAQNVFSSSIVILKPRNCYFIECSLTK